jgi:hypothetical protein
MMLVKLSTNSGVLPKDLFIQGVNVRNDRDPDATGGFADVFLGTYKGQKVAIKRLRLPKEERAAVNPVCTIDTPVAAR